MKIWKTFKQIKLIKNQQANKKCTFFNFRDNEKDNENYVPDLIEANQNGI